MSKSIRRVEDAARAAGLTIAVRHMDDATRTAQQAADALGCAVSQIVKTLLFQGERSGRLLLFLVPGDRRLSLARAAAAVGEPLRRADARQVRASTGFVIGGVAPIGHLHPGPVYADAALLEHASVWAAAGTPHSVFAVAPRALLAAAGAALADLAETPAGAVASDLPGAS